jgi:NAD(P)-dependent dehydrogenase (short-subunit alcohol dehydrogenase family)
MNIKGVAVVTGGASGIGEACASQLKSDGFSVVIADSNEKMGRSVAKRLSSKFFFLDVTDEEGVFLTANEIYKELGPVTVLVNSAGVIQDGPSRPCDLRMKEWDKIVAVDQRGTYVACVAFSERMREMRRGAIVNIASVTGMRSVPLHGYAPAKAAVISMTETLAGEWGPQGIRVNCVSPGYTLTPSVKSAVERGERSLDDIKKATALGRMVKVEEVSSAVSFLVSEGAAAITGINLPVDAGWLCSSSWSTYGGLRAT